MKQNKLHREPNLKYRLGIVNSIKYLGDSTELKTPSASEGVQHFVNCSVSLTCQCLITVKQINREKYNRIMRNNDNLNKNNKDSKDTCTTLKRQNALCLAIFLLFHKVILAYDSKTANV